MRKVGGCKESPRMSRISLYEIDKMVDFSFGLHKLPFMSLRMSFHESDLI
jgi:hypothetical protein